MSITSRTALIGFSLALAALTAPAAGQAALQPTSATGSIEQRLQRITAAIDVPTIGIGAGAHCDGQVLVSYDLLGLTPDLKPKFVKRFAELYRDGVDASRRYVEEVKARSFPGKEHTFGARPCTPAHFCRASTHIGSFEEPKARVGGHHGRAVQAVDLGATLTCRSDYKLSQVRGLSPSADRSGPWLAREGGPSPFCTALLYRRPF
jgi:hypothetical protein